MSMLSRWTIGAIASKKASASAPVAAPIDSASRGAVSGPVATMVEAGGGQGVDPLADDLDIGMRGEPSRSPPRRSRRGRPPAPSRPAPGARRPRAMISEPSARISAWSRPTALFSASSERKLFEQTSSASPSVWCAGVISPPPRISREAHLHARLGELPGGFRSGEAAADDMDLGVHRAACVRANRAEGGRPCSIMSASRSRTRSARGASTRRRWRRSASA